MRVNEEYVEWFDVEFWEDKRSTVGCGDPISWPHQKHFGNANETPSEQTSLKIEKQLSKFIYPINELYKFFSLLILYAEKLHFLHAYHEVVLAKYSSKAYTATFGPLLYVGKNFMATTNLKINIMIRTVVTNLLLYQSSDFVYLIAIDIPGQNDLAQSPLLLSGVSFAGVLH